MSLRQTVAAAVPGRRERRKATTRGELLLAGRKLFSEKGLYDSRVEDLTATAGIAKGTLYRYFRGKDALIQAVVAAGFDDLHAAVLRRARGARSLTDLVVRIAAAHDAFLARNPDLMRVLHQARGMLKFNRREWRPLRASLALHLERLAALIGSAPGSPGPAGARTLAMVVFGGVSGFASVRAAARPDARLRPAPPELPRAFAALARAYLPGERRRRRAGLRR